MDTPYSCSGTRNYLPFAECPQCGQPSCFSGTCRIGKTRSFQFFCLECRMFFTMQVAGRRTAIIEAGPVAGSGALASVPS